VIGRLPFDPRGGIGAKIDKSYIKPTLERPDLPEYLDRLISASLDPDPNTRIGTAKEFEQHLAYLERSVGAS